MLCIGSSYSTEEYIKKSRFIGELMPCFSEQELNAQLQALHSKYPDASHIAYAYRFKSNNGLITRFYDAGEPSGTAGKPIYQHLEGKHIINVLLAVIRYFGGVKLGAGGLTRAYGSIARQVIETADLQPFVEMVQQAFIIAYKQISAFEYLLKKLDGKMISQSFLVDVHFIVELPKNNVAELKAAFTNATND